MGCGACSLVRRPRFPRILRRLTDCFRPDARLGLFFFPRVAGHAPAGPGPNRAGAPGPLQPAHPARQGLPADREHRARPAGNPGDPGRISRQTPVRRGSATTDRPTVHPVRGQGLRLLRRDPARAAGDGRNRCPAGRRGTPGHRHRHREQTVRHRLFHQPPGGRHPGAAPGGRPQAGPAALRTGPPVRKRPRCPAAGAGTGRQHPGHRGAGKAPVPPRLRDRQHQPAQYGGMAGHAPCPACQPDRPGRRPGPPVRRRQAVPRQSQIFPVRPELPATAQRPRYDPQAALRPVPDGHHRAALRHPRYRKQHQPLPDLPFPAGLPQKRPLPVPGPDGRLPQQPDLRGR